MEDHEWERTSSSWKALIPNKNFNCKCDSDESIDEYYLRLKEKFCISKCVLQQWLYELYYEKHIINNYGWIDFDKVEFKEVELSIEQLNQVYVINEFRGYVEEGAQYKAYKQLPCHEKDKEFWKGFGTWRTPPVILNVASLNQEDIPHYADIAGELQLVEGHSRLGYLYAIANCKHWLKEHHKVFIIEYKNV